MPTVDDQTIFPVALDLGARFTGVYYAKYNKGASLSEIEKKGEVLLYDSNNYAILLKDRTARRHQRRGYDRLQFAKRLLVLILEHYFKFSVKEHHQAIGFLMNRRGFSFLPKEFSREYLNKLPKGAWEVLPKEVYEKLDETQILESLDALINSEPKTLDDINKKLECEIKPVKVELVYYGFLKKLKELNSLAQSTNKKNEQVSRWILERAVKEGVKIPSKLLNKDAGNSIDLQEYLSQKSEQQLKNIAESVPPNVQEKIKKLKESIWYFNKDSFNMEKNEENLEEGDVKTHLHHLCFAIHIINNELISGGRHRSKFFEEIETDLENMKKHTHSYLKNFALAVEKQKGFDMEKLRRLICHISNFELKPLRAYFNDTKHKAGDQWDLEKLTKIGSRWFMKHWHVSKEKDGEKKKREYNDLRTLWKGNEKQSDIIDFWLSTDPVLTIPPYQNMTNRRPPKCQSLILNGDYLDENYPDWQRWLSLLKSGEQDFSKNYEKNLREIKSQKNNSLLNEKQNQLRQLQLILDASKKLDGYKLNEIWSIIKEIRNDKEQDKLKEKLKKNIAESKLPESLKKDLKFQEQSSFGHFLNKYYQKRRKAKNGRYFLYQEKKEKWNSKKKFLMICTHKPRQKKHQMDLDLANIFQIKREELKKLAGSLEADAIEEWLLKIRGLKTKAKNASDLQKDFRGNLKDTLDCVEYKTRELKKGNSKYKGKISENEKKLLNVSKGCKELASELAKTIWPDLDEDKQEKKAESFNSIFSFAQMYNIVFKDRRGFSNTCPVCSADNSERMQELKDKDNENKEIARASRLAALNIRLIDGAVMRHCTVLARHVADTIWESGLEKTLKDGKKAVIPLILEQNRFAFEPTLRDLKKLPKKNQREDDREKLFKEKEERIKESAQGICAYSGKGLPDTESEHIIPRSSRHGKLNDEANLICVDKNANQQKGKREYTLANLNSSYKRKIFGADNDEQIKNFITSTLWNESEESFKFGQYQSFINLDDKQQKAFRHALFLEPSNQLRYKVIEAIKNLNRALVNGTQRYMAQCIADTIWRKAAKKLKKDNKIDFDYFEYSPEVGHPKSTFELRKYYEAELSGSDSDIEGYKKTKNRPQEKYSHLLDAQMVFLLAAQEHKNEGSMGIAFAENEDIWGRTTKDQTDKIKAFRESEIPQSEVEIVELSRKPITESYFVHRPFHRDSFYAQKYLPLWVGKADKKSEAVIIRAGFSWENSVQIKLKPKEILVIFEALRFAKNPEISRLADLQEKSVESLYQALKDSNHTSNAPFCIVWGKQMIQRYMLDNFSTKQIANGENWDDLAKFMNDKFAYRTEKKKIEEPKHIEETLNKESNFLINKQITLPAKHEWEKLQQAWEKKDKQKDNTFKGFLESHFLNEGASKEHAHQKVRKVFSLPVVTSHGALLQSRKSWDKKQILQISNVATSSGNQFARPVFFKENIKETINRPFISKDIFKLQEEKKLVFKDYQNFDSNKWLPVTNEIKLPSGIKEVAYQVRDRSRVKIRIQLAEDYSEKLHKKGILNCKLIKCREDKKKKNKVENKLRDFLESSPPPNSQCTYSGSDFPREIKTIISKIVTAQKVGKKM